MMHLHESALKQMIRLFTQFKTFSFLNFGEKD